MGDVEIPPDESVDPPAKRVAPDFTWWDRSRCRTPMPWTSGPGAGFTTGRPWLRVGPDAATRNVEVQSADPTSVLAFYRRMIALRAATPALQVGSFRPVGSPVADVVAFMRELPGQRILVALNLGREAVTWSVPDQAGGGVWQLRLGTVAGRSLDGPLAGGTGIILAPDEALILEGAG
jgi:alpha-glucosidase